MPFSDSASGDEQEPASGVEAFGEVAFLVGAGRPNRATMQHRGRGCAARFTRRRVTAQARAHLQQHPAADTLVGTVTSTIELRDPPTGGGLGNPNFGNIVKPPCLWVYFRHAQRTGR